MTKNGRGVAAGKTLVWLAQAVALACLVACGGDRSPEASIQRVQRAIAGGEYAEANIDLRQLIQAHPNRADARYLLGKLLALSGDLSGAEVELRRALELGYVKDGVYPALAGVLLMAGKPAKVVDELASFEPAETASWADLKGTVAEALATTGKIDRARALVDAVLKRAPGHAPTRLVDARLRVGAGDVSGALQVIDQVLAQEPKNRPALRLRGDIALFQLVDAPLAIRSYEQLVSLAPKSMDGYVALITAQVFSRDLPAAVKSLEALRTFAPLHPQTRFLEAQLAYGQQNYAKASELALQLLKAAPQDVRLLQLAGGAELKLGRVAQAEALLGKSVYLAPEASAGRRLLAAAMVQSGRAKKALDLLRPLLDAAAPDADALGVAAEACMLDGQFAQARAFFERALKLRPDDFKLRTSLALMQLSKGDPGRAFAELNAIAASSEDTSADMVLITQHMGRGEYDRGFKAIDALERKLPKSAQPPFLRGRAYAQQGDDAKARSAYEAALQRQPNYFPAVAGLALLHVKHGEPAVGRKRLEDFVKAEPTNEQGWIALAGLASRGRAAKSDAQSVLERAIAAAPGSAELRVLLADHLLRHHNATGALNVARAAQAVFPNRADVYDVLGRAQFAAGDTMQAMKTFSTLAGLQPTSPAPLMRQLDVLRAKGDLTGAMSVARRAHELAPGVPAIELTVISLAQRAKQPDKALQFVQELKRRYPDSGRPNVYEGDIRAGEKNWEAALSAYREGTSKSDPGLSAIRLHATLLQLKRLSEGERFSEDWWRKHPRDASFAEHLGDVALFEGDPVRAERWYRQAVSLVPDRAKSLNNLAWALLKQGKTGATPLAERAVALAPERHEYLDTLATSWDRDGQVGKAQEVWTILVDRAPDSVTYRLHMLAALIKSGDKGAAQAQAAVLSKQVLSAHDKSELAGLLKRLQP